MIFLTVGTWCRGYDRLIESIDRFVEQGVITEPVTAQIGAGEYLPRSFPYFRFCSPDEFQERMKSARIIVTHAGIGTIGQAIQFQKPIIVLPRQKERGEVCDDHQYCTCKYLEQEGKILVAWTEDQIPAKLQQADTFVPNPPEASAEMIQAVDDFLAGIAAMKQKGRDNAS